ncbi:MAG: protein-disulfide reductase DsbD family protein, partial [Spirochaetia bacterium]
MAKASKRPTRPSLHNRISSFSVGLSITLFSAFFFILPPAAAPLYGQIEGMEMNEPSGESFSSLDSVEYSDTSSSEPPSAEVEFEGLDFESDGTPSLSIPRGERARFKVRYSIPQGFYQEKEEEMFTVSVPSESPVKIEHIEYPEGKSENGTVKYEGETFLEVSVSAEAGAAEGEHEVPVTAFYQLCDEGGTCFFPEEETAPVSFDISGAGTESEEESEGAG